MHQAKLEGYEVAIFDDGLQDKNIMYNISFVCFNKKNFIGNGLLIPAGPLRESLNNLSNAMAGDYTIANTTVQTQTSANTSAPAYANYGVNKGKWYWEVKCAAVNTGSWTYSNIGVTALLRNSNAQTYNQLGAKPEDYGYYAYNGHIMNNDTGNTGDAYGNTYTLNDIIGVALDLDNNKLYFHKLVFAV